jgi:hypothetical protein
MVLLYMVVSHVVHPCEVVVLIVHQCTVIEHMELLHTMIDLIVPPCMMVDEGIFALESWGLLIDREKFLAEEFPPDWVEPTKCSQLLDMNVHDIGQW